MYYNCEQDPDLTKQCLLFFHFYLCKCGSIFWGNQSPSVVEPVLFDRSRCKGPASALLAFRERPGCELKSVGIDRLVGGPKVGIAVACGVHRAGGVGQSSPIQ